MGTDLWRKVPELAQVGTFYRGMPLDAASVELPRIVGIAKHTPKKFGGICPYGSERYAQAERNKPTSQANFRQA